jgi:L-ascorbate metabolism protein UlaG (beta-lactamase superfamily)
LGSTSRRLLLGAGVGAGALSFAAYKSMPAMFWERLRGDISRDVRPAVLRPDPSQWPDSGLHGAWLGHSSVLMKVDGFTILTDPVLKDWIGVDLRFATVGMKRLVGPALAAQDLPHIDLILSSHAHMDHLDLATMRSLEGERTDVVMAKLTSDLVRANHYRSVQEAGWGETMQVGPASIRALEVRHWGARMRTDTYRGYNGYEIRVGRWRVLFAGDTADTDLFRAQRNGGANLAIMPIGAYDPWIYAHCNPEQAWRMANEFGAEAFVPVHHQTFQLSREPVHEPLDRVLTAAGSNEGRIVAREIGSEFHLS